MSDIDQVIKDIRPKLRHVAPQTYWASIGFGIFNIVIGISIMNISVLVHLSLLGFVPIQVWGLIFFIHGLGLITGIVINNYRMIRRLLAIGIILKSSWLIELLITVLPWDWIILGGGLVTTPVLADEHVVKFHAKNRTEGQP